MSGDSPFFGECASCHRHAFVYPGSTPTYLRTPNPATLCNSCRVRPQ